MMLKTLLRTEYGLWPYSRSQQRKWAPELYFMSLLGSFHPHPFNKLLLKTYYKPSIGSLAPVVILCLSNYSRSAFSKCDRGALGTAETLEEGPGSLITHKNTKTHRAFTAPILS